MLLVYKLLTPAVVLAIFFLDRITKHWVQAHFFLGESLPVTGFFHLTYVQNTGAAFSLGRDRNSFFIGATLVILAVLFWLKRQWEKSDPANLKLRAGLALVVGGALGNLYDRIRFGSVIDFLDFFVGSYHWPAFNVADSAICVGAFLLAVSQWKAEEKPHASHPL